jgi:DNA-directed RNA polymerase subunit RPC12/RpoP
MDPPPQIATSVESKNTNPTISREGSEKIILTREDYGQTRDTLPTIEKKKNVINRDLKTEEEKTLSRWWRHISKDGRTYEQCLKCGKYVFISAVDEGKTIGFRCPECGASYTLKK